MNIKSLALTGLLAGVCSLSALSAQAFENILPEPDVTSSEYVSGYGLRTFRLYDTQSCTQTRIRGSVHTNYSCPGVLVGTYSNWPRFVGFHVGNSSLGIHLTVVTERAGYGKYSIDGVVLDGGSVQGATGTCSVTSNTISCFAILNDGRRMSFNSVLR